MPQPQRPLTIYKASAGSGKTFTLAVEYIKLLILDPQNYRYILAVTFTNKATEEMKMRILSQLYGIANNLPDSEDYMNCMRQAFQGERQINGPLAKARFSDEEIVRRAGQAMHLILHNYNYFRVVTIDSFFQNVLRNLARELGLTANLQIGLNDEEIEQQAVDNIIENVTSANDQLLNWIMDFAQEKMNDQKDWNIIGSVKQFGKNIFQDFYKDNQEKLRIIMDNPDFFRRYTQHLRNLRKEADDTMRAYSEKFKDLLAELGLDETNLKGSTVKNYYAKLAEGNYADNKNSGFPSKTLRDTFKDPSLMVKKADMGTRVGNLLTEEIGPLLQETEQKRKECVRQRNSAELTLGNLNELRLLRRIEQEVRRIHDESNTYPLSATQKLIETMIEKQDSPFIYEKIGGQLKYIMIDEFQDTSHVQWENFKVLLDDCLAHNSGSLIVGDVKQSIYRWRNGDWHLLQNLTPEIDPRITLRQLDTNYRSKRNIIHFNNMFFQIAAQQVCLGALRKMDGEKMRDKMGKEALDICRAYSDVAQKVAPRQQKDDETQAGYVSVKLLSKDSKKEDMIPEVEDIIRTLVGAGIPQQKMAILVRYNSEITALAEYFQQKPIVVDGKAVKMVSDQAFRLDASLAVNTIIRAMKFLSDPNDTLLMATLVKAYHKVTHPDDSDTDTKLFVKNEISNGLPQDFLADRTKLLSMPLIGMAEEIYRRFELEKLSGQSAYICALFDKMGQFMQNHLGGLDDFLNEWDENLCAKSIHSSEVDGIRLLTIHKSKGLEFDNVIFPYCNWTFESIRDILWANPEKPYNAPDHTKEELPLVPLKLNSRKLRASVYDVQYESEHLKNLVDNLNLIYVAFTRAGRNLFVIGKDGGTDNASEIVREVFDYTGTVDDEARAMLPNIVTHTLLQLSPTPTIDTDNEGNTTFCYGTLCPSEETAAKTTRNVFEQKEQGLTFEIRSHKQHATFKQSNASADFTATEEEEEQIKMRQQYIQTGNVLHKLFANIRDINDVPAAIENLEYDGVLYNETLSREQLQLAISTRLQKPEVAQWFRPGWTVFNECSILSLDDETGRVVERRPDRVISNGREMMVVDFKTGRKRDEHQAQVRAYMILLKQMGYGNIHGYLWYIRTNEVVKIDA